MLVLQTLLRLAVWSEHKAKAAPPFNSPPGVDVWCGKAYRATNSAFDPGGQFVEPPLGNAPRLDVAVYPRYSYYLDSEENATLIVDTPITYFVDRGLPFSNSTFDLEKSRNTSVPFTELMLYVRDAVSEVVLVDWVRFPVDAMGMEVPISLEAFKRSGERALEVIAASPDAIQSFQAQAYLSILPNRTTGSMARTDRLTNVIHTRSTATNNIWEPLFPIGFYASWDWIVSVLANSTTSNTTASLADYQAKGYNLIHPVPPGDLDGFDATLLSQFLAITDALNLHVMYDLRHTYQNSTSITLQLDRLQDHPSLLLYYTADEPDGATDPLNATSLAYAQIRTADPYHPVSLVLNCANFYFEEYTSGADIILEDTYPLIKSSTFSPVYNTSCNSTYGDCGCDDCHTGDPAFPAYTTNRFLDIPDRVDSFHAFQTRSRDAKGYTKPTWGVPQSFFDAASFWSGFPSAKEWLVMALLRVVHGEMGLVGWIYPTSGEVDAVASAVAKVLGKKDVTRFLTLGKRVAVDAAVDGEKSAVYDAAVWTMRIGNAQKQTLWVAGHGGEGGNSTKGSILGIVVHASGAADSGTGAADKVTLDLPCTVVGAVEVLYGEGLWKVESGIDNSASRSTLTSPALGPLGVSILRVGRA